MEDLGWRNGTVPVLLFQERGDGSVSSVSVDNLDLDESDSLPLGGFACGVCVGVVVVVAGGILGTVCACLIRWVFSDTLNGWQRQRQLSLTDGWAQRETASR